MLHNRPRSYGSCIELKWFSGINYNTMYLLLIFVLALYLSLYLYFTVAVKYYILHIHIYQTFAIFASSSFYGWAHKNTYKIIIIMSNRKSNADSFQALNKIHRISLDRHTIRCFYFIKFCLTLCHGLLQWPVTSAQGRHQHGPSVKTFLNCIHVIRSKVTHSQKIQRGVNPTSVWPRSTKYGSGMPCCDWLHKQPLPHKQK